MAIAARLRDLNWRAYWACQRAITPGLRYSQNYYEDALRRAVQEGVAWLDVGCGKRILPEWRQDSELELVGRAKTLAGLDPDLPSLQANNTIRMRITGFADRLPFRPETFDLVTANMVLEHVRDPADQFREILRVLRPGGRFLFHTPNRRGYTTQMAMVAPEWLKQSAVRVLEGRRSDDVFPTFYRANTDDRIRDIAASVGFETESIDHIPTAAQFAVIPPLAVMELLWIRQLMKDRFARLRQTLVACLRKPGQEASPSSATEQSTSALAAGTNGRPSAVR